MNSKKLDYCNLESTFQIENMYVSSEISVSSNHWQIICVQCKYILWCQPITQIQVVSTSVFHEYWWNDVDFIFFVPSI